MLGASSASVRGTSDMQIDTQQRESVVESNLLQQSGTLMLDLLTLTFHSAKKEKS
jgi:hypothetical protein